MAEAGVPPAPETGDPIENYLEALRRGHDGYPDCCTYHVQYQILSEHRVLLERELLPF
jgi:hypothetical protein